MKFLKNHPFAVQAYFDSSLVLTFAVPKAELESMIPDCLTLDTFQDKWAFIAVAMVQTSGLRPLGFPRFMGNDFFLIGYRIFVRYTNRAGKRLRGLYILKSETDTKKMEFFGNIFTHYNYTTTDIKQGQQGGFKTIESHKSNFHISYMDTAEEVTLPKDSPFPDWKTARRYAGPLPHTFTVNQEDETILTILGIRQNWIPKAVQVQSFHFEFLNQLELLEIVLANAFQIQQIPYQWQKGKIEKWS